MFEPLDLVAQITFPREHVVNVGDAIEHTLLRTGYVLVERSALSADAARFLQLPLPEAQRSLGPFSVQGILDVLVGPAWNWHRDNVRRKVWFTLAKEYMLAIQEMAGRDADRETIAQADLTLRHMLALWVLANDLTVPVTGLDQMQ